MSQCTILSKCTIFSSVHLDQHSNSDFSAAKAVWRDEDSNNWEREDDPGWHSVQWEKTTGRYYQSEAENGTEERWGCTASSVFAEDERATRYVPLCQSKPWYSAFLYEYACFSARCLVWKLHQRLFFLSFGNPICRNLSRPRTGMFHLKTLSSLQKYGVDNWDQTPPSVPLCPGTLCCKAAPCSSWARGHHVHTINANEEVSACRSVVHFSFLGSYMAAGFWWKPLTCITRITFLSQMKPIGFSSQQHSWVCIGDTPAPKSQ